MATIGELHNVPEPGAGVTSQWAQDVTNRIVHRFASVALMNAWPAADGSLAFTAPTLYRRIGGAWVGIVDSNAAQIKNVRFGVVGGFPNVTTNSSGDGRINFPYPFASVPGVAATVGGANSTIASVWIVTHSHDVNGFSVRAFFGTAHDVWQGTVAVGYVASGAQLA